MEFDRTEGAERQTLSGFFFMMNSYMIKGDEV